jgi:hypothetical protein
MELRGLVFCDGRIDLVVMEGQELKVRFLVYESLPTNITFHGVTRVVLGDGALVYVIQRDKFEELPSGLWQLSLWGDEDDALFQVQYESAERDK